MHPCNSRTGSRHSRHVTAATATGLQLVGPALTHSMDQVFTVIGQLDHLIEDLDGATHASSAPSGWLHDLRCARQQLDDVLLGHDRMRELLTNLHALTDPQAAARAPLDLNRCLSRVIYVTRALVPPRLQIVQRMGTVPLIHGSVSALTQALIGLTAHAAHAIGGRGRITMCSAADAGRIDVAIDARAKASVDGAEEPVALPDHAWRAAVAVLKDHGARVHVHRPRADPQARLCIRLTWPAPAPLLP